MAKKVFVFLTFAAIITLVAMALTKPEPWEHQAAVREIVMKVVGREVANMPLPKCYDGNGCGNECSRQFPAE